MYRRRSLLAIVAVAVAAVTLLGSSRPAVAASTPDAGGPYGGIVGETIEFSAVKSINAVSWRWDFGDGTTATGMRANKVFTYPGVYYVVLTTTDTAGTPTSTVTQAYIRGDGALIDPRPYGCSWLFLGGYLNCAPFYFLP